MTHPAHVTPSTPVAHPMIFSGGRGEQFRVSVLADDLIRVQHLPEGRPRLDRTWMVVAGTGDVPWEGRRRDDLSPHVLPEFDRTVERDAVRIRTRHLDLDIHLGSFWIRWADAQGRVFASDLGGRAYPYDRAGTAVCHYMERGAGEHYYGFGERSGDLDKAGARMRMLNVDALGYDAATTDPLYKHIPFYITFVPDIGIAYGLLYDNLATTTFDLGCEIDAYRGRYRYYQADGGDLDYYLIYGPSFERVVEALSGLTGRIALPPRWSLGYLGSGMGYTEAPAAEANVRRFVDLCREHRIPCDGFHLSSGYTTGTDGKRYVFMWDREKFPDPRGMAEYCARAGIRLAANIKPCLLTTHPRYEEVAALGGFVRAADADVPEVSAFWGGEGASLDFTNPETVGWWKARVRELLGAGIAATWNDNNEYEMWDDEARCAGFGDPLPIGLARPLHALLMARASFEAQREVYPDERPYVISRSGCPGAHRYAQTWSGDNTTSWETLRYNIPMGLSLSLSGWPNTGHDVGGFVGGVPSQELFVRWVQNGIFHPRFTIHSWRGDGTATEPWMYPEVLPIIRDTIEFRYRLMPYLYTLVFEAAQTGHPIIRPMVYAFPHDPRCHTESFDFMFGPSLLVASVLTDGARTREVYLPGPGQWCDFYTGEWHPGGRAVLARAPLEHTPLFVPAGGIIPLGTARTDVRQAYVFPDPSRGRGTFTVIEDDGISLDYQRGGYTRVTLDVAAQPHQISLRVHPPQGGYALPYGDIEFILPHGERRPLRSDGEQKVWSDQEGRRHVTIPMTRR